MIRAPEWYINLAEESSEVAKAATKCLRFGEESVYNGKTNYEEVCREIGDVLAIADLLMLDFEIINQQRNEKYRKLSQASLKGDPV